MHKHLNMHQKQLYIKFMKIILTDKFNTKRTSYILPYLTLILLTVHAFHKHLSV